MLALYPSASADKQAEFAAAIERHHAQLKVLAEHCAENFQRKATLVAAERSRVEGKDVETALLYEQAIREAKETQALSAQADDSHAATLQALGAGGARLIERLLGRMKPGLAVRRAQAQEQR